MLCNRDNLRRCDARKKPHLTSGLRVEIALSEAASRARSPLTQKATFTKNLWDLLLGSAKSYRRIFCPVRVLWPLPTLNRALSIRTQVL